MDILKATPEFLAEYVNYFLDFSRRPIKTVESITAGSEDTPRVSGKLFGFLLLSVGVSIVINYIGVAAEMAPDKSKIVQLVARIDEKFLPVAVLIAIVVFAVVSHVIFIAVGFVQALLGEERFKGASAGAVNAFTGFAAWSAPIILAVIVGIRVAAAHTNVNPLILLAFIMPLSLILPIYFIASLAGGYRITVLRASFLFGMTFILIFVAADLLQ